MDFFSKGHLKDLFLDVDNLLDKRLSGLDFFDDGFLVVIEEVDDAMLDGLDDLDDRLLHGLSLIDRVRRSLLGSIKLNLELDPLVGGESARVRQLEV